MQRHMSFQCIFGLKSSFDNGGIRTATVHAESLNDVLFLFSVYKLMGTEHNDRLFLHAFSYGDKIFYNSRRFFHTRDICTPFLHY
jgi:hypothetical protein